MKNIVLAIVFLASTAAHVMAQDKPAAPQSVTLTFNQEELNALVGLIDAGVKALGLAAVPAASRVILKLQQAQKEAAKPAAPPAAEKK